MVAVVELVVVILQWKTGGVLGLSFLGVPTQLQQRTLDIGAVGRPFGTIIHPVFLSDVLGMFVLVALCVAIYVPDRRVKQAALVAVPICLGPIFISSARGPALALGVTMAVLIVFAVAAASSPGVPSSRRRAPSGSWGPPSTQSCPSSSPRTSGPITSASRSRPASSSTMSPCACSTARLPLIGTGLNNYTQIMNNFAPFPLLFPGYPAHNLYLLQLAENRFRRALRHAVRGHGPRQGGLRQPAEELPLAGPHLRRRPLVHPAVQLRRGDAQVYSLREEVPLAVFWPHRRPGAGRPPDRARRDVCRPPGRLARDAAADGRHRDRRARPDRSRRRREQGPASPVGPTPAAPSSPCQRHVATGRPGARRRPALSGRGPPVARRGRRGPGCRSPGPTSRPQHARRATRLPTLDGQPEAGPPTPARPVTPAAPAGRPPRSPGPVAGAPVPRRARSTPGAPRDAVADP